MIRLCLDALRAARCGGRSTPAGGVVALGRWRTRDHEDTCFRRATLANIDSCGDAERCGNPASLVGTVYGDGDGNGDGGAPPEEASSARADVIQQETPEDARVGRDLNGL